MTTLSYNVYGSGDPLLLIHGFGLDSRIWYKQAQKLSKTNKVITYDLRGFGKSPTPTKQYSHVDDIYNLLQHLKVPKVKIVGHSFGGEIAIEYAMKYPNQVDSLILVSSSLKGIHGDDTEWRELMELGDVKEIRKRMLNNRIFDVFEEGSDERILLEEIIQEYSGFHFLEGDKRVIDSTERELKMLTCPVTVVIGDNDEDVQKAVARKFQEELNIEPIVIPNCGHMIMLEKPDILLEIITG